MPRVSGPQRGRHLPLQLDRLADDADAARADGCAFVRLDLPWATAQPVPGRLNGEVVEVARSACEIAAGFGLGVWFRLYQPVQPRWFDNDGGFTDDRAAARDWPRWVEAAGEALGDVAAGWVPFEAPFGIVTRLAPGDPRRQGEILDRLVTAWRDAWRILRGGAPVATSLDVTLVRPAVADSQAHIDASTREDTMRWFTWLHALSTGEVVIPGRADRTLADLAGACDIVGIAVRADSEGHLHRTAEMGPERPLALTFRAPDGSDAQRTEAAERMWAEVARAAAELPLTHVTTLA